MQSALLWSFTFLFTLRVAGQAIQRWAPNSYLPAAMVFCNIRHPRGGRILLWLGRFYMAGSLARIAIGIAVPGAPAWFSTWIPALFHVVLAAYVLVLARFHPPGD